jgi:hypothetical protein
VIVKFKEFIHADRLPTQAALKTISCLLTIIPLVNRTLPHKPVIPALTIKLGNPPTELAREKLVITIFSVQFSVMECQIAMNKLTLIPSSGNSCYKKNVR